MKRPARRQPARPYDPERIQLAGGEASVDAEKLRSLARLVLTWLRDQGADVAHQGDLRAGGEPNDA